MWAVDQEKGVGLRKESWIMNHSVRREERRGRSWHSKLLAYYQPGCGMALVGKTPASKPCRETRAGFVAMAPCLGLGAMLTWYKRARVSPWLKWNIYTRRLLITLSRPRLANPLNTFPKGHKSVWTELSPVKNKSWKRRVRRKIELKPRDQKTINDLVGPNGFSMTCSLWASTV